MNDRIAIWFPIGLMLLLAGLTYWLDHSVQPPPPTRDGSNRHDPDYIIERFTATRLGIDGKPAHSLAARKMVHYPDDDSSHLEQPTFSSFQKDKPQMRITGDKALVSRDGEHVYFTGNVRVTREAFANNSELIVTTSYLHIIPDKGIANTNKPVVIRNAHTHITAIGLELNDKTRNLKLFSRVKGRYDKAK